VRSTRPVAPASTPDAEAARRPGSRATQPSPRSRESAPIRVESARASAFPWGRRVLLRPRRKPHATFTVRQEADLGGNGTAGCASTRGGREIARPGPGVGAGTEPPHLARLPRIPGLDFATQWRRDAPRPRPDPPGPAPPRNGGAGRREHARRRRPVPVRVTISVLDIDGVDTLDQRFVFSLYL
jgi:hypothetical protein